MNDYNQVNSDTLGNQIHLESYKNTGLLYIEIFDLDGKAFSLLLDDKQAKLLSAQIAKAVE